jgi:signal transduction histidine kinase
LTERLKDEFICIASHELKTPATSIQAYSQLLYEELAKTSDKQSAELVKKLNSQVARLTSLTKELLDVTRISQGQTVIKRDAVDLTPLIAEIVEEMQVTTPIRLKVENHQPLPAIRGDRERIGQVLVNLLANAMKFAPGSDEIIIRPTAGNGRVTIAIQDFGIGISEEGLQHIFDRFYRLEETTCVQQPGVGLGLYISSEIIRRHGGDISVVSQKNKGSVFTISLPLE